MTLRRYITADRAAVRRICCDTADAGGPVEGFFDDRELCADLLTRYYTDFESDSLWVVEVNGQVAGYLAGCMDTARMQRMTAGRVLPLALLRALVRGLPWRKSFYRMLYHNRRRPRGPGRCQLVDLRAYPAHVHVNLDIAARGRGLGSQLLAAFFSQAAAAGVPGVHAWVRADNRDALRFFARAGFVELGRVPMMWRDANVLLHSVGLVCKLPPVAGIDRPVAQNKGK